MVLGKKGRWNREGQKVEKVWSVDAHDIVTQDD